MIHRVLAIILLASAIVEADDSLVQTAIITNVPTPIKIAFSGTYHLIFSIESHTQLSIYDVRSRMLIESHKPVNAFTDLDITPDGRYLFVADYGGSEMGSDKPYSPHYVHRYDIMKGKWVTLKAPWIGYRIEAVSESRVLLLELDQWVDVTINSFNATGNNMVELCRARGDYFGDIEYDPKTGRIFHGNTRSSSSEIHTLRLDKDSLIYTEYTEAYGTAQNGGGSSVLSLSGVYFFYGKLQVDAKNVQKNIRTFPEAIYAANDRIACGHTGYYDITTAKQLGTYATLGYENTMAFSENGTFFCRYNEGDHSLRIYRQSSGLSNQNLYHMYTVRNCRPEAVVLFDLLGKRAGVQGAIKIGNDTRKSIFMLPQGNASGLYLTIPAQRKPDHE